MKVIVKITQLFNLRNTRMGLAALVLCCALLASFRPAAAHIEAPAIRVSGSVLDPNHAGIPGATVTAASSAWRVTTRTGPDGGFSLSLTPGDYELAVEAE